MQTIALRVFGLKFLCATDKRRAGYDESRSRQHLFFYSILFEGFAKMIKLYWSPILLSLFFISITFFKLKQFPQKWKTVD